MSQHLTLLLPGLLDEEPDGYRLPVDAEDAEASRNIEALEWLLTLAECRPQPQTDPLALLWQQAGQTGSVPVAALSYRHDLGEWPVGPVLRADPVCLAADRDCVRLLSAEMTDLKQAQAEQLITEINAQFSDEPWRLVLGTAQRWYLVLDSDAAIITRPPGQALGGDIHDFMPGGERQRYWRSIVNEIQMLMYSSAVNQQRQAAAQSSVTSVWLWGEGDIAPASLSLPWVALYGNNPVLAGLGLLAGVSVSPAPMTLELLLDQAPATGRILCWPSLPAGHQGRISFNHDWVLPLYRVLQRGLFRSSSKHQLASVELLTANGDSYVLSAGKRRWWRRRQRIERFLG